MTDQVCDSFPAEVGKWTCKLELGWSDGLVLCELSIQIFHFENKKVNVLMFLLF